MSITGAQLEFTGAKKAYHHEGKKAQEVVRAARILKIRLFSALFVVPLMDMGSLRSTVIEFIWENRCLKINNNFDWGKNQEASITSQTEGCL